MLGLMFKWLAFVLIVAVLQSCNNEQSEINKEVNPLKFVNPFIGTSNNGNNLPGAVLPWGMVTPGPHSKNNREVSHHPATYIYGDSLLYGFGVVNLPGLGCPVSGSVPIKVAAGVNDINVDEFASEYTQEVGQPGYYGVLLQRSNVFAEMTATQRSARFRFMELDEEKPLQVFLDLAANKSHLKGGRVELKDGILTGFQWDGNFCGVNISRKVYFAIKPLYCDVNISLVNNDKKVIEFSLEGQKIGAWIEGKGTGKNHMELQVGISFVSSENALQNLEREQQDKSFESIKNEAQQVWKNQLSKVQVKEGDPNDLTTFYTALYHSLLLPQVINDVNGEYPCMGSDEVKKAEGYTRYTTYSLWDTYRTLHPLLALLYPEQQRDMVVSMVEMYKEHGWLPKWELFSNESWVMVGDPSVPVIVDSYLKGIRNFDAETALEAMLKSAKLTSENPMRPGNKNYLHKGYIPVDDRGGNPEDFQFDNGIVWGPVSTTLEYNLADYCIAQLAKELGYPEVNKEFLDRSQTFKVLYDSSGRFFRPKLKSGEWMTPFNPLDRYFDIRWKKSGGKGYVEGNAWQYAYFVPHAMDTLVNLMGKERFVEKLDSLFEHQLFDMTNEPDISFPYLYNYIPGQYHKTQQRVRELCDQHFFNAPDGLPGNDDAGTLSAWLVFSYLGIYPDAPGIPTYQLVVPKFDKVILHLDTTFYQNDRLILTKRKDADFIDRIKDSAGNEFSDFEISHNELVQAGELSFK